MSLNPLSIGNCLAGVKCRNVIVNTPSVRCKVKIGQVLGNFFFMRGKLRLETKYLMRISTKLSVFRLKEVITRKYGLMRKELVRVNNLSICIYFRVQPV